jgi:hypothetical protein
MPATKAMKIQEVSDVLLRIRMSFLAPSKEAMRLEMPHFTHIRE